MSVNFYTNNAMMFGIDPHKYEQLAPPPVVSKTIPRYPHIVAAPFIWITATYWKRTGTVTTGGAEMIQRGFDLYLVPHVPIPGPPPSPKEVKTLAMIHVMSSSKARMCVNSVSGEGTALACCLALFWGLNLNCAEPFAMPLGNVISLCSVKTEPTLGDYLGAAAGMALDIAIGSFVKGFLSGLGASGLVDAIVKHLVRRRAEILKALGVPAAIADTPSEVQKLVQRLVDAT